MEEIWKPVAHSDLSRVFEVSCRGRVRRVDGKARSDFFKPFGPDGGYKQVGLRFEGKMWQPLVHRLVAMAFLENPKNLPEVHHLDSDKENNCVENLQWVTRSQNQLLTIRECPNRIGEGHYRAKLNDDLVRAIRARWTSGETLKNISQRYGVSIRATWCAATGRTWKHVE